MPLTAGTRVGPYEITALIGQGGMGEVYRATDTNLKRAVAIKVLPDAVAADRDRLARFQREAEVLAALNHPNIAQIYGLERADGTTALVMELVEGPTLADLIAGSGLTAQGLGLDQTLAIARQLAEALDAAHEQGIVHRDLKPANVKVRDDGTVKVLDFGLAKALEPRPAPGELSQSPTITSPAMTQAGMILGTAPYMAPEQARGRSVDKRADIWAFGCVCYEMLTGKRPFDGEDVTEIIGAIVHKTPNLDALPRETPDSLKTLVRLCLVKDPKRRLRDAGDLQLVLDGAFDRDLPSASSTRPSKRRTRLVAAVVVAGLAGMGIAAWTMSALTRPDAPAVPASFEFEHRSGVIGGGGTDIVVTPDGRRVAYLAGPPGGKQIYVRSLDRLDPVAVGPAGQLQSLSMSPDGQWIGYVDVATRSLMKINVAGGAALTVCGGLPTAPGAAAWSTNDLIIFAISERTDTAGLWSVPAAGGTPQRVLEPERTRVEIVRRPAFLPGGRTVLFDTGEVGASIDTMQIEALDLESGKRTVVLRGGVQPQYLPSGHLVYATEGAMRAVRFDPATLEVTGAPVQVLDRVVTEANRTASFSVSASGTAAFVKGNRSPGRRSIVWVDSAGREEAIGAPRRAYAYAILSPDNSRIALDSRDEGLDIWIWHLALKTMTRLTLDTTINRNPVWVPPDGRRLAFSSVRDGVEQPVWQAADGSSPAESLASDRSALLPKAFSPDGRWMLVSQGVQPFDLIVVDLHDTSRRPRPLLETRFNELNGEISPDGKWLAYQSNESGRYEVYVRPFPEVTNARFQVSTGGGTRPAWSHDRRYLFYSLDLTNLQDDPTSSGGAIVRVPVRADSTFTFGPPATVVKGGYPAPFAGRHYDIARDGRFLMIKDARTSDEIGGPPQIVVVQNWLDELKRLVPVN